MKKLILLSGAILLFGALASAKSATSSTRSSRVVNNIKDVRTVYVRKIEGDREFARRLTNEIKSCGLCFVDNAKNADALFSARGDYQDGAFYGAMKFVNRSGKTLWSASATRPKGSNYMAYSAFGRPTARRFEKVIVTNRILDMNEKPVLSVVVPVYNGAKYLRRALQNIQSEVPNDTEIIVVDDGSTDDSAQIARGFAANFPLLRVISQENGGPAVARNVGIRAACAEFLAFLDVDDLWPAGSLGFRLRHLQNDTNLDLVLGRVQVNRVLENEITEPFVAFLIGAALYRKRVFDKVGLFDESLRFSEDTDWFLQTREKNIEMLRIPETTIFYHLHGENMTNGKTFKELDVVYALKRSLDRRRKSAMEIVPMPDLPPLHLN